MCALLSVIHTQHFQQAIAEMAIKNWETFYFAVSDGLLNAIELLLKMF